MTTGNDLLAKLGGTGYMAIPDGRDVGRMRVYRTAGGRYPLVGMFIIRGDRVTYAEFIRQGGGTRAFPFLRLTPYEQELERLYQHIKDTPA